MKEVKDKTNNTTAWIIESVDDIVNIHRNAVDDFTVNEEELLRECFNEKSFNKRIVLLYLGNTAKRFPLIKQLNKNEFVEKYK